MNILIAAKYSAPKSGNFIASLLELGLFLREQGNQVYFMFPEEKSARCEWLPWLRENNFEVTLFDDRQDSKQIMHQLQDFCRQREIQLMHVHFSFCLKELLLYRHKLAGVKILIHDHMDYSTDRNISVQLVKQRLLAALFRLHGIGTVSVMEKKDTDYRRFGVRRHWFVPNALSLRRYVKDSLPRAEMRQKLGIADDVSIVLLLGWKMHLKGVDIAIRAVEQLRRSDPNVQLGFLGFGEMPSQDQCAWIREHTGIDPLDTPWLRFFESVEDIFACHRAMDAYLSASRREAFSYGLLEAISQNIPVVVSNIEGTAWALNYNKSFVYPVEDPSACAQALGQALAKRNDPSNLDEMLSRYHIDNWCSRIFAIYQDMLR